MAAPSILPTGCVPMARRPDEEAPEGAQGRADNAAPAFSAQVLEHIRSTMVAAGDGARLHGEELVNSAKAAGICPPDDRAFGALFAKAIRLGLIKPVDFAPRAKGHGTAGGRVYAGGRALQ